MARVRGISERPGDGPGQESPPPPPPPPPAPDSGSASAAELAPPTAVTQPTSTDGFAIAALVFGIIGGVLLGIIFGIVSLRRIGKRGTRGRGLAIAGIVLSCLWILFIAAGIAVSVQSSAKRSPGGITVPGDVTTKDLRIGDCVRSLDTGTVVTIPVGPCSAPHVGEVYEVTSLPAGPWPGDDQVKRLAEGACLKALPSYVSAPPGATGYAIHYFRPLATSWADNRRVVCIAHNPTGAPLTGSIKGTGPLTPSG